MRKSPKKSAVMERTMFTTEWTHYGHIKDGVSGLPSFSLLSKVAKLVLTLPHSNADEEHVFSLIRQNKTDFRNSLALDGTLSSILTVKMSCQEPCYKFEPTADVIKKSKKQRGNIIKHAPARTNNNQTSVF